MLVLLTIIVAYLVGAIPFGLIITKFRGINDIRKRGSGNIGATNVWRVAGPAVAVWVFVADIGKGVFTVLLASFVYVFFDITSISRELFLATNGAVAVLGHIFPVYLRFRGGKGVNTTLGVVFTLLPLQTLISLGVFIIVLLLFRYVSLGSILATITLSITLLVQKYALHHSVSDVYVVMIVSLTIVIVIAHRRNIARICSGQENRFSISTNTSNAK